MGTFTMLEIYVTPFGASIGCVGANVKNVPEVTTVDIQPVL
jgi:hypothetical protein